MDAKSKLMKMYKKSKSDKSNKTNKANRKKKMNKHKSRSTTPESNHDSVNLELDEYLSIAIQKNAALFMLPICILEHIFYDYFYPFQRYKYVSCCKLFRYIIDDTLQSTLNHSINDHRIHNFRFNAFYFYEYLHQFIVITKSSVILDLSNEKLRMFNREQKQFIIYLFMFQSKLSMLYKKEISSSKFKRYKKREQQEIKKQREFYQNFEQEQEIKPHYELLTDFVNIISECNKVIAGANAIWFHVMGMDIFGPLLYSKYCQISSLSLDRDYINDEILLSFCKSLLMRNALYSELSPFYDCKFLKRLDLSHNNNITDIGMNTLFAVIGEKLPNLNEIYLSNLPAITNLTCKIIYRFYQLFYPENTRLKMVVLNRNKFIDSNGVDILNDLFKNNVIEYGDNVRFFLAKCDRILWHQHNGWDRRINLEMNL